MWLFSRSVNVSRSVTCTRTAFTRCTQNFQEYPHLTPRRQKSFMHILSLKSYSELVQHTKQYHYNCCFSKKILPTNSNLKTADTVNGNPRYVICKHQVPAIASGKQEESIRKVVKNLPKLTTISCGLCFQAFTAKIAEIGRVLLTSSMLNALPNQVIFCRRYLLLNFKPVLFPERLLCQTAAGETEGLRLIKTMMRHANLG